MPQIGPGSALLHYRLVERLGAGGMGEVWKAIDTTLDREVAIKILPPAFADDPERLSRFEREAKLLASLNHPNVAAVYGLHQDGAVRFLAMELVRGRTLTEEIAAGLTPSRVVELGSAIADGLAAAHRQHVVHRDLKPDNIVIDHDGRPKILDFGLAKQNAGISFDDATVARDDATAVRQATTTRKGTILGTVAYMSPEQAQAQPTDSRSDIFSLGIVLYEMTTGQRPFRGGDTISVLTAILRDAPQPIAELSPAAPAALDRIIRRCLEKKPADRFSEASALRDELLALRSDIISGSGKPPVTRRASKPTLIAIAAVAVIGLTLLGSWMYRRQSQQTWLHQQALPQLEATVDHIQALEEGRESWDAFVLGRKIEAVAAGDPLVTRLRSRFTQPVTITSDPPGATVSIRYYDEPDSPAVVLGKTPLSHVAYPRGFTRIHLDLAGRRPVDDVIWNFALVGDTWSYHLPTPSEEPEDMAWIPPGKFDLVSSRTRSPQGGTDRRVSHGQT